MNAVDRKNYNYKMGINFSDKYYLELYDFSYNEGELLAAVSVIHYNIILTCFYTLIKDKNIPLL